jgi:ribonuclease D
MYRTSIKPEEIEMMELGCFTGDIKIIDTEGPVFDDAVAYLSKQKMIGFDTETRPVFSPHQHHNGVAILQLSGPERAFLFRVQKLGLPKKLCKVLSDPRVVKIGAACHDDVRGLQRISPFRELGYVDLQKIVWEWGIADKSVKKMAAIILGCKISKTQQVSNWEAERLTEAQIKYAATDAWVCLEMYKKLLASEKNPLPLSL